VTAPAIIPPAWPVLERDGDLARALRTFAAGVQNQGPEGLPAHAVGHAAGLVVAGEPGVGKTTLASGIISALLTDARNPPLVVPVLCTATSNSLPWSSLAPSMSTESLAAAMELGGSGTPAPTHVRQVLYRIEDAHLLDTMSASYISWQVRAGQAEIVATVRQLSALPESFQMLLKDSVVESLRLEPLDAADTRLLLEKAVRGPVDPDAARHLYTLTRGNPMYLREVVRSALQSGDMFNTSTGWQWRRAGAVPGTLSRLIERDMAELPDALRDVLELVAFSEPIALPLLLKMVRPQDFDACLRAELITLVHPPHSLVPEVVSAHPLKGEAIRAAVSVSNRLRLHQMVNVHRATADDGTPASTLRSTFWALECGLDVATPTLIKASWLAGELQDFGHAVLLADAALARADLSPVQRLGVLAAKAFAASFIPGSGGGVADLEAAWALLPAAAGQNPELRNGGPDKGAAEFLEAALAVTALRANFKLFRHDCPAAALEALDQGELLLGPAAKPTLDGLRVQIHGWAGNFAPVIETGEAALSANGGGVDEPMLAYLSMFALGLGHRGELFRALELCREGLKVARRCTADFPWAVGELRSVAHHVILWIGDIGQLEQARLERRDFDPPGIQYDYTLDLVASANVARAEGRWMAAAADLQLAVEKYGAFDRNGLGAYARAALAAVLALAGRKSEAAKALTRSQGGALRGSRNIGSEIRFMELTARAVLGDAGPAAALELADWAAAREARVTELDALHLYVELDPGAGAAVLPRLVACGKMVDGGRARWLVEHARALAASDEVAARRARDNLAAHGVWVGAKTAQPALTSREHQIAVLVAAGLGNREIGERLVVSVRTVESHVGRIFTKLGINSRDQLAARF
jgi:DNA-binding CsgD family transcriptional regulator